MGVDESEQDVLTQMRVYMDSSPDSSAHVLNFLKYLIPLDILCKDLNLLILSGLLEFQVIDEDYIVPNF